MAFKTFISMHIIVLVILFLSSTHAKDTVTIVSTNYPPHIWKEDGEVRGLRVELLTELFDRMGYHYIPRIVPWKRAIAMVKTGQVEGIGSVWYRPERESFLHYPKFTFSVEILGIYQPTGAPTIRYQSLEDFQGMKLGIVLGFAYPEEFLESKLFRREEVRSDEQNLLKLSRQRVDVVISDTIVADYKIKQLGLYRKIVRNPYDYNEGIWGYIAFSKRHPRGRQLAQEYDKRIQELVSEGFYQHIFQKYLGRGPDELPTINRK